MNKKLSLSEIVTDAGTQVRAGCNEVAVTEYAEALAGGAKFPPVIVFYDGRRHIVADGFHRIQAALRTGATGVECDVRKGGTTDALKFALGCNAHHGLRRTNADKRHAVGMALKEFPKLSDVAISDLCLVGRELVAEVRKEQVVDSDNLTPPVRIGKDGKEYRLPPAPQRGTTAIPPLTNAAVAPITVVPPPPPTMILDDTRWRVPTQLIPLWRRAGEVQEILTTLSRVKGALRAAQENKDLLFAEVNYSSALSQLDQAWTDIKTAIPFAVCPTCQGQLADKCALCKGRGLISEHRWNTCVTREDKEFRFKARQTAGGLAK